MIVAELSGNHNGDLQRAKALIYIAKQAGADAVKLQTYTADTITINSDRPEFQLHGGLWNGRNLYDLYEWAHTPWEWHSELFRYAKEIGIVIFSSPFDLSAVAFLESLNCPIYKIASFEAMDLPLIRGVALTGKPIIISTGVINDEQIQEALDTVYATGNRAVTLLHCISQYPAKSESFNLKTIKDMQQRFSVPVGLSDHTLDNTVAIASTALGAVMVEKHFTVKRSDGGPDADFSLEPEELASLVNTVKTTQKAMGQVSYQNSDKSQCHRSLYVVKSMKKGEYFTPKNIRSIRPGLGMEPKYIDDIIGKKCTNNIAFATPMKKEFIDEQSESLLKNKE
ncbi:N-acetylneuraminate synthase [hydrothermal vent metagenome]|uniref:N-acetylneuraminate synthase n=1 Tax=hydrothermal vent metagenome TaxID=652676 RepID=A0A3B0WF81_9ZZZZ